MPVSDGVAQAGINALGAAADQAVEVIRGLQEEVTARTIECQGLSKRVVELGAERDGYEREYRAEKARIRALTQVLISAIGGIGRPMNAEEAVDVLLGKLAAGKAEGAREALEGFAEMAKVSDYGTIYNHPAVLNAIQLAVREQVAQQALAVRDSCFSAQHFADASKKIVTGESPAPASGEEGKGEPWPSVKGWPYSCDKCGERGESFGGCGMGECHAVRESATPSPVEPLTLTAEYSVIERDGKVVWRQDDRQRLVITPADARRIVALAQGGTDA